MIFPALAGKTVAYINIDEEAVRWFASHPRGDSALARNPLLDPAICQQMIDACHRRLNADWSYGGYLEDRRHVWSGSYLDRSGDYIHLGVDFNVPQGTDVVSESDADIILVDDDRDEDGGWGQRIIARPKPDSRGVILIYSHLQNIRVQPGSRLPAGTVLAEVGGPPHNGNWHSHLHVQAMRQGLFEEILLNRFQELDGYGHPSRLDELRTSFPDPLAIVSVL